MQNQDQYLIKTGMQASQNRRGYFLQPVYSISPQILVHGNRNGNQFKNSYFQEMVQYDYYKPRSYSNKSHQQNFLI
jgi:hypothetical protein